MAKKSAEASAKKASKQTAKAAKKAARKTTKKTSATAAKSSAGATPVDVGKTAPAFTLADQQGNAHKLADYRGKWVVLYFYPKDDTPGCTREACDFRDSSKALAEAGAAVLGVSPDDEASHAKFAGKFNLAFPLLADHEARVCGKYGVWQEKSMYGRKYMGVVRTTYLIDPQGKVARRWDKVKVPGHTDAVLSAVHEAARKV